jgi:peptidoglycan-N-acetylglucosamine deacetylase
MSRELTPNWIKKMFPHLVWEVPSADKDIYLTFDDGPTPGITPQVSSLLKRYNAKASFFCLGSQAEKYPELLNLLETEGNTIGNHGYKHLSGFSSSTEKYIKNTREGALITKSSLFRPPYGKITPWQISYLRKEYRIIMWSIMSMDYNIKLTPIQCLDNVLNNVFPGAIVVFHDTEKAAKNLLNILPLLLENLCQKGYKIKSLPVKE